MPYTGKTHCRARKLLHVCSAFYKVFVGEQLPQRAGQGLIILSCRCHEIHGENSTGRTQSHLHSGTGLCTASQKHPFSHDSTAYSKATSLWSLLASALNIPSPKRKGQKGMQHMVRETASVTVDSIRLVLSCTFPGDLRRNQSGHHLFLTITSSSYISYPSSEAHLRMDFSRLPKRGNKSLLSLFYGCRDIYTPFNPLFILPSVKINMK